MVLTLGKFDFRLVHILSRDPTVWLFEPTNGVETGLLDTLELTQERIRRDVLPFTYTGGFWGKMD